MESSSFQHLDVWKLSHSFVLEIYRLTKMFPADERFGLVSQMRRAAVSIPANIAEGYRRRTKPDKVRMMNIAQGSLEECRYYLILAHDLSYADTLGSQASVDRIGRMLSGYIAAIVRSMSGAPGR